MAEVFLATEAMATRFELYLIGSDPARLRAVGEEALAEIRQLDRLLSRFRPDSDIGRINAAKAGEKVRVDGRTFRLLQEAIAISQKTEGAFDISVGPLLRCWGIAHQRDRLPSVKEREKARLLVGPHHLQLDQRTLTVEKDADQVQVDLGAIGKGYALDRAVQILLDQGMTSFFLHGGTSSAIGWGEREKGQPWTVALGNQSNGNEEPITLALNNVALSVSTPLGRFSTLTPNGKPSRRGRLIGHTIDPRTGLPVKGPTLSAVLSPSATVADALSTAALIAHTNELHRWVAVFPKEIILICHKGRWKRFAGSVPQRGFSIPSALRQ
ncbi:MAG: FAD:protein FMN transferase [Armatimonadetes bacterium]|nr:FAD:protein FMN transferase [Armatimonadota bacterium]MDW8120941.1 FAD:protein FMN transferase [Armatimonadota bacterium]